MTAKNLDSQFQFRIPSELLVKALEKAREQDLTLSQVLRRFLREWVEDPPEENDEP